MFGAGATLAAESRPLRWRRTRPRRRGGGGVLLHRVGLLECSQKCRCACTVGNCTGQTQVRSSSLTVMRKLLVTWKFLLLDKRRFAPCYRIAITSERKKVPVCPLLSALACLCAAVAGIVGFHPHRLCMRVAVPPTTACRLRVFAPAGADGPGRR
jgi:hypothetical protein